MAEYEFEDEQENQDEEATSLKPQQISQAVLSSTDWTTQTIISQLTQGNIDLILGFSVVTHGDFPEKVVSLNH